MDGCENQVHEVTIIHRCYIKIYFNYTGEMYTQIYGLDEYIYRKMEVIEGTLDWEKFKTGDYIIANGMIESKEHQSMGMLRRQIYEMLITEAGCYLLFSMLISIVIGYPFGKFILAVSVPCLIFWELDKKEDLLCRLRG